MNEHKDFRSSTKMEHLVPHATPIKEDMGVVIL